MSDVMFLVGNGLNFFIRNYVSKKEYEEEIIAKWNTCSRISGSWNEEILSKHIVTFWKDVSEYCGLLDFVKLEGYDEAKGETLLSKLEKLLESFDEKEEIIHKIEDQVKGKITEIFEGRQEKRGYRGFLKFNNAKAKFAFADHKGTYFSEKLKEVVSKHIGDRVYHVFTTNYDGIPNSIFTEKWHTIKVEGVEVHHLHGHYDDKTHGEIICCAPNSKESRIKNAKDTKNHESFEKFQKELGSAKIVILFGSGLTSDPHILEKLNEKSQCTFIVIGSDSEAYIKGNFTDAKDNKFTFLEKNDVYFIDTAKSTTLKTSIRAGITKIEVEKEVEIETPEKLLSSLEETLKHIKKHSISLA